jgi:TetR/AcrR family transcriptional repressor of nem operon
MPRTKSFNKETIIELAIELFWKNGYEKTSMQNLVDYLGVGRGSLYNTFKDKHELFVAALRYYSKNQNIQLQKILRKGPIEKVLKDLFTHLIEDLLSDTEYKGCFITNTTTDLAIHDVEIAQIVQQHYRQSIQALENFIGKSIRKGELLETKKAHDYTLLIVTCMEGMRVLAKNNPQKEELEAIARMTLSLIN